MKPFSLLNSITVLLGLGLATANAQSYRSLAYPGFGDFSSDDHTILLIKSDGSCVLTNENIAPRPQLEMQVRSWEQYQKNQDADADEVDLPPTPKPPTKPDQKPLSDTELAAKLREMYSQRTEDFEDVFSRKVEVIEVMSNSVRIVSTSAYKSLKDLASRGVYGWGPTMLMFENARFEIDTNRQFRLTFTPARNAERYVKTVTRNWKDQKLKYEWKIILPGKILNSGLPQTQGNATWITIDAQKQDSMDAALKLISSPLAIIAEPAGLALAEPLDAMKLMRAAAPRNRSEPDIPITDAGPGFVAEASGLSLSTVYLFPEGQKLAKDRGIDSYPGMESPGTTIYAKLFAPKGRIMRSVSDLRVKSAKDDKGRAVSTSSSENPDEEGVDYNYSSYSQFVSSSSDSDKPMPAQIQLRLALPAPDAHSIDELQAEAVALTIGGWKEMTLTNVQADTNKVIDLGEVLPDAKLVITKVTGKKPQTTIQARLEGPPSVSQLEVRIKPNSRRGGSSNSNMSERHTSTTGPKTTRNITVSLYDYESMTPGATQASAPLTLLIRYPQDAKRERLQFKLTGLDLL